jgi:Neuraminidase-like domain
LVAYVMQEQGFERMEQLFEYFLVDPGMEPVVQTSRLRLAISSVQTFIQRCFLNLEAKVLPHSSIINSQHWQWMKRYRVWEANRKIYLFPENWLEPEFRDDKTYLFQSLEGALMQGDVSSDLVEDAFLTYLKTLDVLARLEMVTMYCEHGDDPAPGTLHVIGRTHNNPHNYFYRRYAQQMWTPWEPVTVEIAGDHVVAVVWRKRLHLFWVTFLEKAEKDQDAGDLIGAEDSVGTCVQKAFNADPKKSVDLQLNWSDYFQGQWTARASSGLSPLSSASLSVEQDFSPDKVFISVSYQGNKESGVKINLTGALQKGFLVIGRNSPPIAATPDDPMFYPYMANGHLLQIATEDSPDFGLAATQFFPEHDTSYDLGWQFIEPGPVGPDFGPSGGSLYSGSILGRSDYYSLLFPSDSPAIDNWPYISPFFYMDSSQTFFVEPTLTETTTPNFEGFGLSVGALAGILNDKQWEGVNFVSAMPVSRGSQLNLSDAINTSAKFKVQLQTDWITNPNTLIKFNGGLIGSSGLNLFSPQRKQFGPGQSLRLIMPGGFGQQ